MLQSGGFAYKLKKPVTLPFLDYGTLAKRRAACQAELRLNRRFAPHLYLDVVELAGEPAVKMRRFAEAQRLDHVCRRGELKADHLATFARDFVAFQNRAEIAPPQSPFGAPQTIAANALENFDELECLHPAAQGRLSALRQWTCTEFARCEQDFAQRKATGRVRDGHGDLHLANLVLEDAKVTPFDCIEFNEEFRWIDVANEIAFTLLDLLEHGQPGLATLLLDAWLTWSGDHGALAVLRFYLVYRAMVRAKVAAIRGDLDKADAYLGLAARLAASCKPTLTITFGPSGCGKTFASGRRLAAASFLDTVRIRSDVERKRLYNLAPDADSGGKIYGPEATRRTYARLAEVAQLALSANWSVIVDAAFLRRAERAVFRTLAARFGVPFAILAPEASQEEMLHRLATRQGDASEATPAVLLQQLGWLEPLTEEERRFSVAV